LSEKDLNSISAGKEYKIATSVSTANIDERRRNRHARTLALDHRPRWPKHESGARTHHWCDTQGVPLDRHWDHHKQHSMLHLVRPDHTELQNIRAHDKITQAYKNTHTYTNRAGMHARTSFARMFKLQKGIIDYMPQPATP